MSEIEFSKQLKATETPIEGLVVYDLPVFGDNRGWFKENWQREKMVAAGLPDFGPVQNIWLLGRYPRRQYYLWQVVHC